MARASSSGRLRRARPTTSHGREGEGKLREWAPKYKKTTPAVRAGEPILSKSNPKDSVCMSCSNVEASYRKSVDDAAALVEDAVRRTSNLVNWDTILKVPPKHSKKQSIEGRRIVEALLLAAGCTILCVVVATKISWT